MRATRIEVMNVSSGVQRSRGGKQSRRSREVHAAPARASAKQPSCSRARKRTGPAARQEALPFRAWGGARPGAGRKRRSELPLVPHRARAEHAQRFPVLVTSRLVPGLRSLRNPAELELVRAALARSRSDEFQIVHHSIQSNHLHMIVEASDRKALTRGVRGLVVRIAGALNRLWQRRGTVLADRFHERELRTPREVRNSLLYVLQNARKHGIWMRGPDPCSSGVEFDGWWSSGAAQSSGSGSAQSSQGSAGTPPERERGRIRSAWTWLLGIGWRRHGLLREHETPNGAFGRVALQLKDGAAA